MLELVARFLFWTGLLGGFVAWIGYPALLFLLTSVRRKQTALPITGQRREMLSVIIAAHNEEANITDRLRNIIGTAPADFSYEVIVMSDRSTDRTVELVRAMQHPGISVYETSKGAGRASAHNEALDKAKGSILVFTDAETEFAPGFLDTIGHAFDDPKIAFASGTLSWRDRSGTDSQSSFSIYWRFEKWLRSLESNLGICAVGTGACCAVRRSHYRSIPLQFDVDCYTPYDVVQAGANTVCLDDARATDYEAQTVGGEFRARVRMTSKNVLCLMYQLRNGTPLRRAGATAGLVIHKLARWLTPVWGCLLLLGGGYLIYSEGATRPETAVTFAAVAFLGMSLAGAMTPNQRFLRAGWMFLVANMAFLMGLYKFVSGQVRQEYKKEI